jgi:hypothetical protein
MDFLQTSAREAWDAIKDIFQSSLDAVRGMLDGILPAMKEAGAAIVKAIKDGIAGAWDDLIGFVNDKLDGLTDLLPWSEPKDPRSPLRNLSRAGAAIVDNIATGLADAMPVLQAQLGAALNPAQQTAPVTTVGGNTTNISKDINIEVISKPAGQPSEQAIFWDVSAALAAART